MPRAYSYIRFSHALQSQGDSRRRQTQLAEDYAREHALDLDATPMLDLGISAYRGKNRQGRSGLAVFLELLKAGKIARGSYLLVESLDRLSRDKVMVAFNLFNEILAAGVTIVTLTDRQTYTSDAMNDPGRLFLSLGSMLRAHDESLHKSKRRQQAWSKRRKDAVEGKVYATKNCPAWLKPKADRSGFDTIPDRVHLVRQIFDWADNGMGVYSISRRLNERGIKPWGPARKAVSMRAWGQSSVVNILQHRAVLGEHQFYEFKFSDTGKERVPVGEPLDDYYPRIIKPDLFHRVQAARTGRRVKPGRRGKFFSNLFTGLLTCFYCGAAVYYVNKGSYARHRSGHYLRCAKADHKGDCHAGRWRYIAFEAAFLKYVRGLDPRSIASGSQSTAASATEAELVSIAGELTELSFQITRLVDLDSLNIPEVRAKLQSLNERRAQLEDRQAKLKSELEQSRPEAVRKQTENLVALASVVSASTKTTDEVYQTRASMASELGKLITGIKLRVVNLDLISPAERPDADNSPAFVVTYRTGGVQQVVPDWDEDLYFTRHQRPKAQLPS